MQQTSRRTALLQMAAWTLGSSIMMEGCGLFKSKQTNLQSRSSLDPVYIPAGSFPPAKDGISYRDNDRTGPKVRSEYTNGKFCCAEIYLMPKRAAAPPHVHKDLDEVMRVMEGTVHMLIGEQTIELHAGDWHVRPHGVVHTFWNATDQPAHVIDIYPNQDFLGFFEDIERLRRQLDGKGQTLQSEAGQQAFGIILKNYGIEMFPELFPPIIKQYGLVI